MNRRELGVAAIGGTAAILALAGQSRPVAAQEPGPVIAIVTHPVADYATWRVVYDEAGPVRDAAGVTGAEVFRDAKDPNMMVVVHRFPTVEAAEGFFGNPALAEAMKRGGVTAAPVVILATAA
jgi:quinol monooxygenase YgiN